MHNSLPAVPSVLVLLAARNGAQSILRQIDSVLNQKDVRVKIVVRDDNSTDSTREIVKSIAEKSALVRLCSDYQATGSAGGNFFELIIGADLNGFNYVAFCDQDDEWHSNKLKRAISCMLKETADGYSAGVKALWSDGRCKKLTQNPSIRAADHLFEGAGQGCTFVMTAEFFTTAQRILSLNRSLLSQIHYHDWTIYALARVMERRWIFDQEVTMIYYQHNGNDTGARSSYNGLVRRLAMIRKGWYKQQINAINELLLAVRPSDPIVLKWQTLSETKRSDLNSLCRRLFFVAVNSRRRSADRLVLMAAVIFGYI